MNLNIILFEPEIPPNTGNIIRLCANCGAHLHLIEPLGFELSEKQCRRAGLDYHDLSTLTIHPSYDAMLANLDPNRLFACSTKGSINYTSPQFQTGDALLFGPETRGLPQTILDQMDPQHTLRIPMLPHSRSLNLANAVSIITYEAWRQMDFA